MSYKTAVFPPEVFSFRERIGVLLDQLSNMTPRQQIHIDIMKSIARSLVDTPLILKGGTALLLAYGLDRFSEDLDFDSNKHLRFEKELFSSMKKLLYQAFSALFLLALLSSPAQAVGGSSFSACVAEGEVTYAPATAATLSAVGSVDAGIAAAGAAALAADLASAASAIAGCMGAVPCGIAASLVASAASFPTLYGSAEAALGPVARTPGGVATGAFGGMGIVEPLSGPGFWIPVAGGIVLNLESYAVALHGVVCAAGTNINMALSAAASALSSDVRNTTRLVDNAMTHLGMIRERLRMEREYQAEPSLCTRTAEVTQNGPSLYSATQTAGVIDQTLIAQDQGVSSDQMVVSASSWTEPDATSLFGSGSYTLTPQETTSGIQMIWLLTHPTGHAVRTLNSTQTTQDVLPQTVAARESLIRHTLTSLFALRVPPTPGGTSLMENLANQVQERWANLQWLASLHTLHPTTLRREIAMEKSLKAEIRYLRMVSKQHREALLAMIAGEGADR